MTTHNRAIALHTWKIKHSNKEMIRLFSAVHHIDDSISRLEANGDLTAELTSFRLQKTRMREHIYRILRVD